LAIRLVAVAKQKNNRPVPTLRLLKRPITGLTVYR